MIKYLQKDRLETFKDFEDAERDEDDRYPPKVEFPIDLNEILEQFMIIESNLQLNVLFFLKLFYFKFKSI